MLKRLALVIVMMSLTGCGVLYVSPQLDGESDHVRVVPLTAQAVQTANSAPYQARQVPDVFFRSAGASGAGRAPVLAPTPSLQPRLVQPFVAPSAPPPPPSEPYRIGVGDVVQLATRKPGGAEQDLSRFLAVQNTREGYAIQDDGAMAVPGVGRVPLAGLTLQEAESKIFQSLVQSGIDPTFSLEIAEFNSQHVTVGGAVAAPVILPLDLTPLFLDAALTRAGGFVNDDPESVLIRIYRAGSLYQIPLKTYLASPEHHKTRLVAGDSVFVDTTPALENAQAYFQEQIMLAQFNQQGRAQALAELNNEVALRRAAMAEMRENFQALHSLDAVARDYVYLSGEVARPGRFVLPFGRAATLADALFSENGFSSETGNPSQIYVLRGETGTDDVIAWHLDARNVAKLVLATQFQMRPNDIIFIAEQPVTRWNRTVQQIVPSLISTGTTLATQ